MNEAEPARFTALILAGSRPRRDEIDADDLAEKALLPVDGVPMIARVVRALHESPPIGQIVICGLDERHVRASPQLAELAGQVELRFVEARETPSASVAHAMQVLPPCVPLLVTTADHPLLTPAMVESFCVEALRAQADVVAAVVPGDLVRKAFPNSERTFLHFRDGSYCGANLFTFVTREGQRAAEAWLQVERHRKRPWKMIRALGIGVLVRFLLRRISLAETAERLSSRLGIRAVAVVLSHAEAAVDVDTESDLALVEQVLRARRAQGGSLAES